MTALKMTTQEIIDQYGLDKLSRAKLLGRREAARLHANNLHTCGSEAACNHWALVVSVCDSLLHTEPHIRTALGPWDW